MRVAIIVVAALLMVAASIIYGLKAYDIFEIDERPKNKWSRWHQRWFNFCGSIVGWLAVVVIAYKAERCWNDQCPADVSVGDFLLGVVAFVGITGNLPGALLWLVTKAQGKT